MALDGLLLLLFSIGYIARYVRPSLFWWPQLIAIGLPYLSLLVLLATVPVAWSRRWRLLGVHGIALVLIALRFVPAERGAAPQPDDLSLLTINTSRGGGHARADDLGRAITRLIRAEAPDLVAFQEAFVEFHPTGQAVRPEALLAALIDSVGYRTVGPLPRPGATYTPLPVLGLDHVDLLEQTQTKLFKTGAAEGEPDTKVLRTHFRWKGREAIHYNLHLRSFGSRKPWTDEDPGWFGLANGWSYLQQYKEAFLMREQEITQLRAMLGEETLPVIISGDFNSTPHNWGFHGLAVNMQDAFKVAGQGWGSTYHRRWPLARIDHVLVDPAWEVVEAHTIVAPFTDHRALAVRLRWRD